MASHLKAAGSHLVTDICPQIVAFSHTASFLRNGTNRAVSNTKMHAMPALPQRRTGSSIGSTLPRRF